MIKKATLSKCGMYRYRLKRVMGPGKTCLFIMLNPSTADATIDDRTIKRCMLFTQAFGCGRLLVGNLFAFRATKPTDLKKASDPFGPQNLKHLKAMVDQSSIVVAAWGAHGTYRGQNLAMLKQLQAWGVDLHTLEITKGGHPKHPLYVLGDTKPQRYCG